MDEIWKVMPRHPTHLVSNKGRVAKILVSNTFNGKHLGVNIGRRGTDRRVWVHRAVLETFVGPPPTSDSVCRHLNDIPTDNRVENLAWGTHRDNTQDAIRNGRWPINEDAPRAKLSNKDVIRIRAYYDRNCALEFIATKFEISISHVCGIGKRNFWKHLPEDPVLDEILDMEEDRNQYE